MAFLGTLMHLVEGAGPEAVADRFIGVLDEALVDKERSTMRTPLYEINSKAQSLQPEPHFCSMTV